MKITADFTSLNTGENLTRRLDFNIEDEYASCEVRLGFVTPMGRLYVTDVIELTDNCGHFLIPDFLLDGKGRLLVQILLNGDKGIVAKSKIEEYPVYLSLDDMRLPAASDGIYTFTEFFDIVAQKADKEHSHEGVYCTVNEIRELISAKSDISHDHDDSYYSKEEADVLFSEKSDSSHDHDDRYYSREEADTLLEGKCDSTHEHDDRYYGREEADALLEGKCDSTHEHDDRYYSREEADALLEGKCDSTHEHDDRYYGREEADTLLAGKSDSTHNHDDLYLNKNEADYIVEQGVSGKWKYRKWNSGYAECWRLVTQAPSETLSGGDSMKTFVSYPFTFAETPHPFISQQSYAARVRKFYQQNVVVGSFVINSIIEDNETLAMNESLSYQVYVKGKWK